MATRTAFPGTISTSTPVSHTNNNRLPGGWVARKRKLSTQGDVTTEVDVTDLQEDVTLALGREYKVSAIVHALAVNGATIALFEINDGTARTQIGRAVLDATSDFATVTMFYTVTGDGSSHDLQVRAAGTGNGIDVVAGGEFPCELLVEDVGPSS